MNGREELEQEKDLLKNGVFALLSQESTAPLARAVFDPDNPAYVDPGLSKAIRALFQASSDGRLEWLRMETDALRRVQRSRQAEHIHRPYGVIEVVVPVLQSGEVVHAIFSGPMKIGNWSARDRQTLAKVTGVAEPRFPPSLNASTIYEESHLTLLVKNLQTQARLLEAALDVPAAHTANSDATGHPGGLDVILSGLPHHLGMLFRAVQGVANQLDDTRSADQLTIYSQRGNRLLQDIILQGEAERSRIESIDLHVLLDQCIDQIESTFPTTSFTRKWQAAQCQVTSSHHSLHHLASTLLNAVADGLGHHGGLVGVSTRDFEREGRHCVHVEIRDGGGFATFAGVEPVLDELLQQEQNDFGRESADWVMLAEALDAEVEINTEDQNVTRVDLYVPLQSRFGRSEHAPVGGNQIWIVDDDPHWVHTLRGMIPDSDGGITQLSTGQALVDHFEVAPLPPDLIILDMHLSDMRGSELRTWLYEQDSDLPVILISSMAGTHAGIQTATGLRKTMFLQKPFDDSELRNLISMALAETVVDDQ